VAIHGQRLACYAWKTPPDRQWSSNEKSLIQAVAGEVAIAIENARLIEQTNDAPNVSIVADIMHVAANDIDPFCAAGDEPGLRCAWVAAVQFSADPRER
jgi:hypothetical protein